MNDLISRSKLIDDIEAEKYDFISGIPDGDFLRGNVNFAQAALEIIDKQPSVNNWISVDDRLPEPETMCCVTLKFRLIDFDYKTNKQIGKEYINNHMTEGYYNESMQWELELDNQLVCDYYGKNGICVWEDKISNEKFENGENKIIVDIVSDNKKEITRATIEVLAWYPIMTEPYIQSTADD